MAETLNGCIEMGTVGAGEGGGAQIDLYCVKSIEQNELAQLKFGQISGRLSVREA